MHIILGALTAVVTILILINKLNDNGIDIGWLNPFAWKRRRAWKKMYHANPIYNVSNPMENTALLMVIAAKSEGEISKEQKATIIQQFESVFHLSQQEAIELFSASNYLLKDTLIEAINVSEVINSAKASFNRDQASSALNMIELIIDTEGERNERQKQIVDDFIDRHELNPTAANW